MMRLFRRAKAPGASSSDKSEPEHPDRQSESSEARPDSHRTGNDRGAENEGVGAPSERMEGQDNANQQLEHPSLPGTAANPGGNVASKRKYIRKDDSRFPAPDARHSSSSFSSDGDELPDRLDSSTHKTHGSANPAHFTPNAPNVQLGKTGSARKSDDLYVNRDGEQGHPVESHAPTAHEHAKYSDHQHKMRRPHPEKGFEGHRKEEQELRGNPSMESKPSVSNSTSDNNLEQKGDNDDGNADRAKAVYYTSDKADYYDRYDYRPEDRRPYHKHRGDRQRFSPQRRKPGKSDYSQAGYNSYYYQNYGHMGYNAYMGYNQMAYGGYGYDPHYGAATHSDYKKDKGYDGMDHRHYKDDYYSPTGRTNGHTRGYGYPGYEGHYGTYSSPMYKNHMGYQDGKHASYVPQVKVKPREKSALQILNPDTGEVVNSTKETKPAASTDGSVATKTSEKLGSDGAEKAGSDAGEKSVSVKDASPDEQVVAGGEWAVGEDKSDSSHTSSAHQSSDHPPSYSPYSGGSAVLSAEGVDASRSDLSSALGAYSEMKSDSSSNADSNTLVSNEGSSDSLSSATGQLKHSEFALRVRSSEDGDSSSGSGVSDGFTGVKSGTITLNEININGSTNLNDIILNDNASVNEISINDNNMNIKINFIKEGSQNEGGVYKRMDDSSVSPITMLKYSHFAQSNFAASNLPPISANMHLARPKTRILNRPVNPWESLHTLNEMHPHRDSFLSKDHSRSNLRKILNKPLNPMFFTGARNMGEVSSDTTVCSKTHSPPHEQVDDPQRPDGPSASTGTRVSSPLKSATAAQDRGSHPVPDDVSDQLDRDRGDEVDRKKLAPGDFLPDVFKPLDDGGLDLLAPPPSHLLSGPRSGSQQGRGFGNLMQREDGLAEGSVTEGFLEDPMASKRDWFPEITVKLRVPQDDDPATYNMNRMVYISRLMNRVYNEELGRFKLVPLNYSVNTKKKVKRDNKWRSEVSIEKEELATSKLSKTNLTREEQFKRSVRTLLNKLTVENFLVVSEKIANLYRDATEQSDVQIVVDLLHEKATLELDYSDMYADLAFLLRYSYNDHLDVGSKTTSFHRMLLNKCQDSFEEISTNHSLNKEYILGNIRFMGELFLRKILSITILKRISYTLLTSKDSSTTTSSSSSGGGGGSDKQASTDPATTTTTTASEDVSVGTGAPAATSSSSDLVFEPPATLIECFSELLTTIGYTVDQIPGGSEMLDEYVAILLTLKKSGAYPTRINFKIQDLVDLRKNNWQKKLFKEKATSVSQIHKQVELEQLRGGGAAQEGKYVTAGRQVDRHYTQHLRNVRQEALDSLVNGVYAKSNKGTGGDSLSGGVMEEDFKVAILKAFASAPDPKSFETEWNKFKPTHDDIIHCFREMLKNSVNNKTLDLCLSSSELTALVMTKLVDNEILRAKLLNMLCDAYVANLHDEVLDNPWALNVVSRMLTLLFCNFAGESRNLLEKMAIPSDFKTAKQVATNIIQGTRELGGDLGFTRRVIRRHFYLSFPRENLIFLDEI